MATVSQAIPGEDAYMVFRAMIISVALEIAERASDVSSLENHVWDPGGYAVLPVENSDPVGHPFDADEVSTPYTKQRKRFISDCEGALRQHHNRESSS